MKINNFVVSRKKVLANCSSFCGRPDLKNDKNPGSGFALIAIASNYAEWRPERQEQEKEEEKEKEAAAYSRGRVLPLWGGW